MKKKWIWILIGVVLILIVIGTVQHKLNAKRPLEVQLAAVQEKTIEHIITANGNIQPITEVDLSATISAEILTITVDEGDQVTAGQTLVILDSLRYVAALKQTRSALSASEASLAQIATEFQRASALFNSNLISSQDLESIQASLKLAEAQVSQNRAFVDQATDDLRKTVLVAPMAGTVTASMKDAGEMVLGSMFQADVILTIADLSAMEILVKVDETDVVDVAIGNPVKVEIDAVPGVTIDGVVTQIAQSTRATLGQQNQVIDYEVRILVDMNTMDNRIRPGMSATALISTAIHESVVAIPIQALTARPEKELEEEKEGEDEEEEAHVSSIYDLEKEELVDLVFIAVEPELKSKWGFFGKKDTVYSVELRPVEVGISSDNFYEILSGIEVKELLVVGNYQAVSKDLKKDSKITASSIDSPESGSKNRQTDQD